MSALESNNSSLQGQVKALASRLDKSARKEAVASALAKGLQVGYAFHIQRLSSDAEFAKWKTAVLDWYANTVAQIRNDISEHESIVFRQPPPRQRLQYDQRFNEDHNNLLHDLGGYLENLRHLHSRVVATDGAFSCAGG